MTGLTGQASPLIPPGSVIPPGATIGIMGGGQLGRMTALAAARLGYRCHIYCQDRDEPGAQVAAAVTVAGFDDRDALAGFAALVDVITLEWENIPVDTLRWLAAVKPVRPNAEVLAITQDRCAEKAFANRLGIGTAAWRGVATAEEVVRATGDLGLPAVIKSARFGYDGKGQALLVPGCDPVDGWSAIGGGAAIVESLVPFTCEISVIVARGQDGALASYVPVENRHADRVLATTTVPARLAASTAAAADHAARRLASALALVGVLAVEMFVTADGAVLINEMAPRPHNSGHWTIDAAATSQFEQLVRAVCGLPLGATDRLADAVMENLLGDTAGRWADVLADPDARLHLYGKQQPRPGRKMGHITRLIRCLPPAR
ncbi:MAG: 5-(carboxyamino)imidazole ribonucleotide synthase [Azospirillum sp.]|nr:5-(carboxyamino)imidazole ribonucleotide synthase [Azospirillum sp.]